MRNKTLPVLKPVIMSWLIIDQPVSAGAIFSPWTVGVEGVCLCLCSAEAEVGECVVGLLHTTCWVTMIKIDLTYQVPSTAPCRPVSHTLTHTRVQCRSLCCRVGPCTPTPTQEQETQSTDLTKWKCVCSVKTPIKAAWKTTLSGLEKPLLWVGVKTPKLMERWSLGLRVDSCVLAQKYFKYINIKKMNKVKPTKTSEALSVPWGFPDEDAVPTVTVDNTLVRPSYGPHNLLHLVS